jgi:hypothetical protein
VARAEEVKGGGAAAVKEAARVGGGRVEGTRAEQGASTEEARAEEEARGAEEEVLAGVGVEMRQSSHFYVLLLEPCEFERQCPSGGSALAAPGNTAVCGQ